MTPTLSDLRKIFYGAGAESISDAEYAFLEQAYADGIDAYDLLQLIDAGPATQDQVNEDFTLLKRNLGIVDGQIATFPRRLAVSTAVGLASQGLRLTYFYAEQDLLVGNVRTVTGSTAAAATPTLCRMGLYSVAENGDVTLIGSTANDTTLFAAANTQYTRALTAPVQVGKGDRLAFGILIVTGAALPSFAGNQAAAGVGGEVTLTPRLSGQVAGQADLPAFVASAGIAASGLNIYGVLTA